MPLIDWMNARLVPRVSHAIMQEYLLKAWHRSRAAEGADRILVAQHVGLYEVQRSKSEAH